MRIRLWMIVLGIGIAGAVAMWLKNQRTAGPPATSSLAREGFEGAAAIRANVTERSGAVEGGANQTSATADDGGLEGAAAIRDQPAD